MDVETFVTHLFIKNRMLSFSIANLQLLILSVLLNQMYGFYRSYSGLVFVGAVVVVVVILALDGHGGSVWFSIVMVLATMCSCHVVSACWGPSIMSGCHVILLLCLVHEGSHTNNRSLAYCTLLGVLWQMCHAWITYGMVRRIVLVISKL